MTERPHIYDRMTVDVPEGEVDGMIVKRFTVSEDDARGVQAMRLAMSGRSIRPGTYTKLIERGQYGPWMSDTPAEKHDHAEVVYKIMNLKAKRVLINGLGLGMIVQAALSFDHVEHVDVVEKDQRVIDLVGPHYLKDPRVTIIHADAFEQAKAWPKGTRWDVVYSDIWPDINTDDLKDHTRFAYTYARRSQWQGSWMHEDLVYRQEQERKEDRRMREWLS